MIRKIGELNGKPIVCGDENTVKTGQIHWSTDNGVVILKERDQYGQLVSITTPIPEPEEKEEEEGEDESQEPEPQNLGILEEE